MAEWYDDLAALDEPPELDFDLKPLVEGDDENETALATIPNHWRSARNTKIYVTDLSAALKQIDRLPDVGESCHGIMGGKYGLWELCCAIMELAAPVTV